MRFDTAIQVARWKGAEILATAGTAGKRALLRMLGVRHVFDSRSAGFADEVRAATLGEGVDVVLNTLTGEAIARGIALLAPYGRYIELTKRDLLAGASLDLRPFARNLAYFAVDVADMIQTRPAQAGRILREVVRLVDAGVLTPLPYTEFPVARAAAAFQHLARPEHIGKVVLTFTGSAVTSGTPGLDPDATYLVTGGLGDLGRIVAQWLASSGARHLLLIGRTPRPQDPALAELARLGAQAAYETVDVADETALRVLLDRRAKAGCPPVRGVVHAAGVVDLRLVDELRPDELAGMLRPKVAGGWALHRALQDAPLDFFVLFSSASAVLGSPMLAAYAAANAFLDGLAHHRRAAGRSALAINWGYWSGTGMVARLATEHARQLVPHGMAALTREEGLDALRMLMAGRATQALVLPADWDRWRAAHPEAARAPLLRELFAGTASPRTASPGTRPPDATPRAGAAGGLGGRTAEEYLLSHVASVLGVPAERVSTRRPLTDQGIDSLMAIEVRARVRRDLGAALSVRKILGHQTIAELAAFLTGALNGESPS
jgi:epothilone polyketide synthase D